MLAVAAVRMLEVAAMEALEVVVEVGMAVLASGQQHLARQIEVAGVEVEN
jgi:hypothetical protein